VDRGFEAHPEAEVRTMGIDPSSTKIGIAVVEDGRVLHYETLLGVRKDTSLARSLSEVQSEVAKLCRLWKPERIAIEQVSVTFNMNSVRKIAYFEAACMMGAATRTKTDVRSMKTTSARKQGLGNGGLSKEQAVTRVREMFSDDISGDEADAIVLALAVA